MKRSQAMGPEFENLVITVGEPFRDHAGKVIDANYVELTISASFTMKIGLHRYPCERCGALSPPPTTGQIQTDFGIAELLSHSHGNFSGSGREDWAGGSYLPSGWTQINDQLLCGPCGNDVREALVAAMRRPGAKG